MNPKLSYKIIGVVLLISLLFFPPLAYSNIKNAREILEAGYLEKAKTYARSLDANVRSQEELRDTTRLLATIQKSIWLDPDITGIDVNLPEKETLITFVSSNSNRIGHVADADNLTAYRDDIFIGKTVVGGNQRQIRIITPIHVAKQQVGTFQVELTLEHVDSQIEDAIRISIVSYLFTLLLFIVLLYAFMRLLVVSPVKEMNKGVRIIAKGDLDYRIHVRPSDEIGQLAAAINQMASDLKASRRGLEERKIALEQEVEERRRTEKKLRESEARFRNLAQTATDAIISLDKHGCITVWNRAATQIFGYSESEAIGADFHALIVPKRYRDRAYPALQEFYSTGSGTLIGQTVELVGLRRDGTEFPIELSISSVQEGDAWHATGIVRDITERKKMEEELLKAEKLQSVGILAGGIAHDFNNILVAIMGNISLAKLHMHAEDETFGILAKAEQASLKASALTQQLLTFSRGGAPVKKTASIAELLNQSAGFVLSGSNVCCEISIADDLWPADIDQGQINQVINNLVINADQAMPGGGTVRICAENVTIGPKQEDDVPLQDGKYVKITVADQGHGIPQEHLQKIFDPYFTTKKQGNGLGLAISYSIISRHNGYISAESELGVGTIFRLYLPASRKEILTNTDVKREPMNGVGKILVMDDDEVVRDLAGSVLAHLGYEAALAEDGDEAIELYRVAKESATPFDVVILDLTVPGGMGGVETLQQLLKIDGQVKAVVSSGYSNDPVMSNFVQNGFQGVITKPYKIQEFSQILRSVINGVQPVT